MASEGKLIKIGRDSKNAIVLDFSGVSREHAALVRMDEDTFLLEDRNSTNGTRVNGRLIKKKTINRTDKVQLGGVVFDVNKYFPPCKAKGSERVEDNKQRHEGNDRKTVPIAFLELEKIWKNYNKDKAAVSFRTNLLRMVFMAACSGLSYILGFGFAGMFVGGILGLIIIYMIGPQKRLEVLKEKFMITYVCPKCRKYLGETPFNVLREWGSCRMCKAKWLK